MPANDQLFKSFREQYEFFIPKAYREFLSASDLVSFLEKRYDFVSERKKAIKLRVFNPDDRFYWQIGSSIIEVLQPDCRFIVDTLVEYLNYHGYQIQLLIHPVLKLKRSDKGQLQGLESGIYESLVYIEIPRQSNSVLKKLHNSLTQQLRELQLITGDYDKTLEMLDNQEFAPRQSSFQEWLRENLVIMGAARLDRSQEPQTSTGIFKIASKKEQLLQNLKRSKTTPLLSNGWQVIESDVFSSVNRSRLYYLFVLAKKESTLVLVGIFSRKAEVMMRNKVPLLKDRLEQYNQNRRVLSSSFTAKEILAIAESITLGIHFSRMDLLDIWYDFFLNNLYVQEPEYHLQLDEANQMVWLLATIPFREKLDDITQKLESNLSANSAQIIHNLYGELNKNRLMIYAIQSSSLSGKDLYKKLGDSIQNVFHTWTVEFRRLVNNKYTGQDYIDELLQRYFQGMGPDFRLRQGPYETLYDLSHMDLLDQEKPIRVRSIQRPDKSYVIKIYSLEETSLSKTVPVFGNYHLDVKSEYSLLYQIDQRRVLDSTYLVDTPYLKEAEDYERLSRSLQAVLREKARTDRMDQLVLSAKLDARELKLMKALVAWYFQINKGYSRKTLFDILVEHPLFCRQLIDFFKERHDPAGEGDGKKQSQSIEKNLSGLATAQEENMCRQLFEFCQAIVRTDYFLDHSEISFKIKSSALGFLPSPVPFAEIFVFDYDMEGIHLRGGPVARGGLRWSDRQDDYRVEVLGLMKAQMVKNTVIVPVGSKGGFVLKQGTFTDRSAFLAAGKQAYQRYIECLLRLTDNYNHKWKVQAPPNIRCWDESDPYLVVAADKGTATFSDLANSVSEARQFWLGDAFASGGSQGYDHKVQGITARGAWESVRCLFRELGTNPDQDPIRCVGIGDMGGDVFGNGMLLSQSMQLVAAFNHMYIFLDPRPNPQKSWQERQRLFQKGLNWDAYDPALISKGGGVYERGARRIKLEGSVRQALGIQKSILSGEELIQAILKAPVDLIWNGGIGTYFKASTESHFEASDTLNDRVRIDASQIRARVIGEGGNLGLTQAARIEAANRGVRLNTDAIDNSAGVSMSDHEVNLKILLGALMRKGVIKDNKERMKWIRQIEKREIELVLEQNRSNNLALSLDERRRFEQVLYFRQTIRQLVQHGWINREMDHIPYDSHLEPGVQVAQLLNRPVLSSLMGFQKLHLKHIFLKEGSFSDPEFNEYVLHYFPAALVKQFEKPIVQHPLRVEIITTEIVNKIVNNAGIAFFARAQMRTAKTHSEIATVYLQIADAIMLTKFQNRLDAPEIPYEIYYEYLWVVQERLFEVCCDVLDQQLAHIPDLSQRTSLTEIIEQAAQFSTKSISRTHRALLRKLDKTTQEQINLSMRIADSIHVAFHIYDKKSSFADQSSAVSRYFQLIKKSNLGDLYTILSQFEAKNSWELRFFARLRQTALHLPFQLAGIKTDSESVFEQLASIIHEANTMQRKDELDLAILFEMLSEFKRRNKI